MTFTCDGRKGIFDYDGNCTNTVLSGFLAEAVKTVSHKVARLVTFLGVRVLGNLGDPL